MGGLLSALYRPSLKRDEDGHEGRQSYDSELIRVAELLDEETLSAQILEYATKNLYREQLYACDFYKDLDKRVPLGAEGRSAEGRNASVVWRMNVDHPIVYVLVADMGQQPMHTINDIYGDLVVYEDEDVQEAVRRMQLICSSAGYDILNEPFSEGEAAHEAEPESDGVD